MDDNHNIDASIHITIDTNVIANQPCIALPPAAMIGTKIDNDKKNKLPHGRKKIEKRIGTVGGSAYSMNSSGNSSPKIKINETEVAFNVQYLYSSIAMLCQFPCIQTVRNTMCLLRF